MIDLDSSVFSLSECEELKNLLKNPEDDFQKVVSLLEKKVLECTVKVIESERKYQSLLTVLANIGFGIDIVSKDHAIIYQNQVLKEKFGDCLGEICYEKYMGLENKCDFCQMEETLKYNEIKRNELEGVDNRIYEVISAPYPNQDGTYDKVFEVIIDITERKIAEQKLRESEEKYRVLTEQSLMGIFIIQEGNFKYINQTVSDIIGYTVEEMLNWTGLDIAKIIYSEDIENIMNRLKRSEIGDIDDRSSSSFRLITKSGEIKWIEEYNKRIEFQGKPASMVTLIDITSRIESEAKLKESEEQFRTIAEQSFMGILIIQDGVFKYYNEQARYLNGYSDEEIQNWEPYEFSKLIHPNDKEFVIEQARKKESGDPDVVNHYQYKLIKKNGDIRWVENFSKTINYRGKTADFVMTIDITDKIEAENKIKESEENFRTIAEDSHLAITILQDDLVVYTNQKMADMFGYDREEMLNWTQKEYAKTVAEDSLEFVMEQARKKQLGDPDVITQYPIHCIKSSGEKFWVDNISTTIMYNGRPAYLVSLINTTSKREAEQKLRESEEMFRTITEQSLMGICIAQDNEIKYINQVYADIFGYTIEEMMNWELKDAVDAIHPDDRKFTLEQLAQKQRGNKNVPNHYQYRGFKRSGETIWVDNFSKSIEYDGKPADLITLIDITDKRKTEQKLKESEERYRNLFENSPNAIVLLDFTGKIIDCNLATEKTFGYPVGDLVGRKYLELPFYSNSMISKLKERFQAITKGFEIEPQELEVEKKDGNIAWIKTAISYFKIGERDFFQAIIQDITEQKKAEQQLRESEENFRTIAEDSHLAITILQDDLVVYTNQKMADMFGYKREDMLKWTPKEYAKTIAEDSLEFVMEQAKKKQIGDPDIIAQYPIHSVKSSGEKFWVDNISTTIMYNGRPADLVSLIDTTAKREAEKQLIESEEKFRKITEESLLAISIIQDDKIKYVNQEMANLYGYTVEGMLNWSPGELLKLVASDSLEMVKEQLKNKQTGNTDVTIHYPIHCIRRNGEFFWVDNISKTIMYGGRPADLVTQIEITERMKAQEELLKLNQLKSELLRRTSHELKTPLVSIKGFTELLLQVHRDKLDALVISTLNEIKQGCLRLETLIGDILKTAELESGAIQPNKSEENLSLLVRVCVNELKGFSKLRNHHITLDLPENIIVHFEKEQIHQVISNLLTNAVKYTPPSGLIEIKSEINDNFIVLSIKDNGIGFTEEEKTRIFKQFGKIERYGQGLDIIAEGSGFGLFISKKIIELHGGEMWLESKGRNKGSTFYFSLPLIQN